MSHAQLPTLETKALVDTFLGTKLYRLVESLEFVY